MKKGKIILSSLAFIVAIGGAFAFNNSKFHARNLWYQTTATNNPCVQAACTSVLFGQGTLCTQPSDFFAGYFTESACTTTSVTGYATDSQ
jgi:hypothetical protein